MDGLETNTDSISNNYGSKKKKNIEKRHDSIGNSANENDTTFMSEERCIVKVSQTVYRFLMSR